MPESRYSPEGEDFIRKTTVMEETLSYTQEVLIKFLLSLPAPEQVILSQEAENVFLKNLDTLKVHYQARGQDDQEKEEEDARTIINNETPPPAHTPLHNEDQEDTQSEENLEALNTSTHSSPGQSLASSKTVKLKGKSY